MRLMAQKKAQEPKDIGLVKSFFDSHGERLIGNVFQFANYTDISRPVYFQNDNIIILRNDLSIASASLEPDTTFISFMDFCRSSKARGIFGSFPVYGAVFSDNTCRVCNVSSEFSSYFDYCHDVHACAWHVMILSHDKKTVHFLDNSSMIAKTCMLDLHMDFCFSAYGSCCHGFLVGSNGVISLHDKDGFLKSEVVWENRKKSEARLLARSNNFAAVSFGNMCWIFCSGEAFPLDTSVKACYISATCSVLESEEGLLFVSHGDSFKPSLDLENYCMASSERVKHLQAIVDPELSYDLGLHHALASASAHLCSYRQSKLSSRKVVSALSGTTPYSLMRISKNE